MAHKALEEIIGRNIARYREAAGLTQATLAEKIGISTHDKRMNDCLPPILFSAIFKLLKVLPDTELDAC